VVGRLTEAEALDSWRAFMAFVDRRSQSGWLFRGVGSIDFELMPKIGRRERAYNGLTERKIFKNFVRRAAAYLPDIDRLTRWEQLAVAQHHGLATRLLDWTSNPLVAAYFVVADKPPAVSHQDGGVYAVRAPYFLDLEDSDDPFAVENVSFIAPTTRVPRITSQRGFFTIHPQPDQAWNPGAEDGLVTDRFLIQQEHKPYFLKRLFYLGVDAQHIQADMDGLCRTLSWQYERSIGVGKANY
jgi:hypothetical protein